jgi:hypothetical protein
MVMAMITIMIMPMLMIMIIISPYVHVIKVLLTTAGCGIYRDRGKKSYGVERYFGATGLPEFSTSTQKE